MACGILVPQPEIKRRPPAVGAESQLLNHQGFPKYLLFFFFNNFIPYFFLAVLGLHCCTGFSLVAVRGLLLWSAGSRRAGYSSCVARALLFSSIWDLPRSGVKRVWQADSLPLDHQGSSPATCFFQLFPCMSLNRAASKAESLPTLAEGLISSDLGGGKESCIIRYI